MLAIQEIQTHAKRIADGSHDTIKPGQEFRIPDSWGHGEAVAQGDLIITVQDRVPENYVIVKLLSKQLVPGNTEGAKHCLDSLSGITMYHPPGYPDSAEETCAGPAFHTSRDVTILHPTHGPVIVPANRIIRCDYQREYDAELHRERRNAD